MNAFAALLLPAVSLLLLGAHFWRAGLVALAAACVAMTGLLAVRNPWASRVLQAVLALGAIEWLRPPAFRRDPLRALRPTRGRGGPARIERPRPARAKPVLAAVGYTARAPGPPRPTRRAFRRIEPRSRG